jgi:lysozyme
MELELQMALSMSDIPYKGRMLVVALVVAGSTVVEIGDYEGYFHRATRPVKGDVWTLGHGTTHGVKEGDTITPQRALHRLYDDVNQFADKLRVCITAPLYPTEWGAFLSLSYNIGWAAFCKKAKPGDPPNLIDLINAERYAEACARISEFNHGPSPGLDKKGNKIKGPVLPGLVKRRAAERELCEKGGNP